MKRERVTLAALGIALLTALYLLFGPGMEGDIAGGQGQRAGSRAGPPARTLAPSAREAPAYGEVRGAYCRSESLLLDRRGEVLCELRTDRERRRLGWTPAGEISHALREAVVQAEDRRFFRHRGADALSMGAALLHGSTSESLRGASTISMQLASILDPALQAKALPAMALTAKRAPSKPARRSLAQKVKQILAARELERSWSKDEILEAYLNLVTFRGELQGVAAASRGLFGKDPHGLDRTESLILASLIRSPNASPASVRTRAARLGMAIGWGVPGGEIEAKVRGALESPSYVRPRADLAPHVARKLLAGKAGGSAVACTLDGELQRYALERLFHRLVPLRAQNVADGAVLVVENRSGEVLAYVSLSGEPSKSRYVDGAQAKRQAGSALKPFLYALAFDRLILTPASMLEDSPLDIAVFGGIYQPRNYDSGFLGVVSARTALASSLNVPAVRALSLVGVDLLLRTLRELGIEGLSEAADFYGPSLALGSADVTLWELVGAYRALANGGLWSELRVTGEPGPTRGTGLSGETVPAKATVPTLGPALIPAPVRPIPGGCSRLRRPSSCPIYCRTGMPAASPSVSRTRSRRPSGRP